MTGINAAIGLKNIATKNKHPVVNDDKPVLPPSATPDDDSTNVVTVDVPHTAPTQVARYLHRDLISHII